MDLQEKGKDAEGKTEALALLQCQHTHKNACTSGHRGAP